jgi:hypothetical protein
MITSPNKIKEPQYNQIAKYVSPQVRPPPDQIGSSGKNLSGGDTLHEFEVYMIMINTRSSSTLDWLFVTITNKQTKKEVEEERRKK